MVKETIEFEIYFNDLKDEVQKQLLKTVSASWPDEMNWDTLPVTVVCFEFEKVNSGKKK